MILWATAILAAGVAHAGPGCDRCHPAQAAAFTPSQHAHAFHLFDSKRDPKPPHLPAAPFGVIGVAPLQQLVVRAEGGRFQVFDPAYDMAGRRFFSIFGDTAESRPRPGDWGHFTGRGMTWNAQCAFCHMTDLRRNYAADADRYQTTWSAAGLDCTVCHGTRHAERPADACLACHTRREDLTDTFRPGEPFEDHYRLLLADQPDLYWPNGRAKDEVFEGGSLALSRMGQAGVTCLDCHDPHTGRVRTGSPNQDDTLCLGCHAAPGRRGAPAIAPAEHTHHPAGSPGARCVNCHMPAQTYMGVDLRRDHGFTSPDPRLALEVGLPDACIDCHLDHPPTWSAEAAERWYGAALARPARQRTQLVARAAAGDATVAPRLATALDAETNAAWKASLAGLAAPYAESPEVDAALRRALSNPDARIRAAAIRSLARMPSAREKLVALRHDPARAVRLAADWATRTTLATDPAAHAEVVAWLAVSADQPVGALRQSEMAVVERRFDAAIAWAKKAVAWDPSLPSFHTLARALAAAGRRSEAEAALAAGAKAGRR